jgi:prevent-host-death family protein
MISYIKRTRLLYIQNNMTKLDLTQAQERFGELIALVGENGEQILIEKSGQPIAAIISYAELKRLQDIQADARDSEMMKVYEDSENQDSSTPEEVIAAYNKIHGTDFTVENILNDPE